MRITKRSTRRLRLLGRRNAAPVSAALCEEELVMNCYTHKDDSAIGICKYCYKGVCLQCAIEIKNGLVCSEVCKNNIAGVSGQSEKNRGNTNLKKGAAPHPSAGVVFWAICSIILWLSFLISHFIYGNFELSTLGFSIISTVVLVLASWDLNRKGQSDKST